MSLDGRILDCLARWEELREQGQAASAEVVCQEARCPELLDEVRRQIAALLTLEPMIEAARDGLPTGDASPTGRREGPAGSLRADRSATSGLRYRPIRFHARGSLGEVFVARDEELNREVAFKQMQRRCLGHAQSLRRFRLEAEITGRLEHPGIVPVYGFVQDADGTPSYAMRFIRGESLRDAILQFHQAEKPGRDAGERSLALRKLLTQLIAVCNAVAYAHSRGILHRDIKPANIMLGPYGQTLLVDWGLAKPFSRDDKHRINSEDTLAPVTDHSEEGTQAGEALGTPAFMSPEQAAGRLAALGPTSDVYSLGATLYMLLTGNPPFKDEGDGKNELLAKVRRGDFPPTRAVKPDVPVALDAICRKAMALAPSNRYATASELTADLEHWLADEPVAAYPEPLRVRLGRWGRRHRPRFPILSSLNVLAVIALAIWLFVVEGERQRLRKELEWKNEAVPGQQVEPRR
jgi:serine/threonine-protein kinase